MQESDEILFLTMTREKALEILKHPENSWYTVKEEKIAEYVLHYDKKEFLGKFFCFSQCL